ncbi:MerR family DNA-binding transcriptional regulator [Microbacterium luteolum]|uniref:MerR family DNA-binding transcriptional regulator n=2 Tax=Microbacterium luteolum TaxID=69367 RepID=A0ABY7XT50_MICLT|nr:MerR family DNA-binding transcriptional regulator [Microbacterium luteolum]
MMISELAAQAGVKVSTIRFYERAGLLPAVKRAANGYREYDLDDARHVRFLRRGQELGFALTELSAFAALTGGAVPASIVTEQALSKVDDIDRRIADLQRTRAALLVIAERPVIDADAACPVVEALGGSLPAALPSTRSL